MILLLICFVLFGFAAAYASLARARERPIAIFRHIGLVVQQNLPLPAALKLAANAEYGKVRHILARIATLIEAGAPLADAIRLAYRGCPALPLSVVRTAQNAGTLPSALRELNRRLATQRPRVAADVEARLAYLAVLGLVYLLVLLQLSLFVGPKFKEIFKLKIR